VSLVREAAYVTSNGASGQGVETPMIPEIRLYSSLEVEREEWEGLTLRVVVCACVFVCLYVGAHACVLVCLPVCVFILQKTFVLD
jgi:hypothetical protein